MATANITAARLREVLNYDPETGLFIWRAKIGYKVVLGKVAGCSSHGYIAIRIDKRMHSAHRLAWLFVHGKFPNGWIDHINGNKADNRIANLRDATPTENGLNCHTPRSHNQKSPYIGVSLPSRNKRWVARLTVAGKRTLLGCYDTPELARDAYLEAKRRLAPSAFDGV